MDRHSCYFKITLVNILSYHVAIYLSSDLKNPFKKVVGQFSLTPNAIVNAFAEHFPFIYL